MSDSESGHRTFPNPGVGKASSARIYNWLLDGKDTYLADREAGEKIEKVFPSARLAARTNREFTHRATQHLARRGIHQFLDIGPGMPLEPNLHQIAQSVAPASKVVYVDNDPVVLVHAKVWMTGTPEGRIDYVDADVRAPETILTSPQLRRTLDLRQPVALSLNAVMHFVPDDHGPHEIVDTLMNALPTGSYLVMTHASADFAPEKLAEITRIYSDNGMTYRPRSLTEFTRFFNGLDLLDPGVAVPHCWHREGIQAPRTMDAKVSCYVSVARK